MNWTVQYAEYYLYRGVSRTNAYEFMQQSGNYWMICFLPWIKTIKPHIFWGASSSSRVTALTAK